MVDVNNVFDALPHVNEIWITSDGKFHLHDQNGGQRIVRSGVETKTPAAESNEEKGKEKLEATVIEENKTEKPKDGFKPKK